MKINTKYMTLLADSHTPVSIYLKLRDAYPGSILLESSDFHHLENCYSYICLEPRADFIVEQGKIIERLGEDMPQVRSYQEPDKVFQALQDFIRSFELDDNGSHLNGFFGYMNFESLQFYDKVLFNPSKVSGEIPLIRYHLYRYVISINHFKDQMTIIENLLPGEDSRLDEVTSQIKNRPLVYYPFYITAQEESNMTEVAYMDLVKKAKHHCQRGDVFQLVLSRRFSRPFKGDEFNVYRSLRSINPSPYLFYFDYGDYRIFGSSPEMQLKTEKGEAFISPIAGTFRRTGDDQKDEKLASELLQDEKENAEHVMLVDLARNDLSKTTDSVKVVKYKDIQFYSHVIHIVSTVSGRMRNKEDAVKILADTFPAGTLSGAPKIKAIQLIDQYEPEERNYYGGCIGYIGTNGVTNHAITIRSFLSHHNRLHYQAGAGIVNESREEKELQEVANKLQALRNAIDMAETLNQ